MSAYFMGLDNGGTAVKCVIFDDRGCEIAEASVKTPVLSPRVHFEERDMGELWEANVTVISACIQKSGVDPSDILGGQRGCPRVLRHPLHRCPSRIRH